MENPSKIDDNWGCPYDLGKPLPGITGLKPQLQRLILRQGVKQLLHGLAFLLQQLPGTLSPATETQQPMSVLEYSYVCICIYI